MDEGGFGYAIDNDTKLEYRRKLGSGGFSTVHEVLYGSVIRAYLLLDI
jgi:hypothetical protein